MCAYTAKRESLFVFGAVLITGFVCAVQVEAQRHRAPVKGSMPASDTFAYEKPENKDRFSFNVDNVDLFELVKIIGNITGKEVHSRRETIPDEGDGFRPPESQRGAGVPSLFERVEVNGLTVVPAGNVLQNRSRQRPRLPKYTDCFGQKAISVGTGSSLKSSHRIT